MQSSTNLNHFESRWFKMPLSPNLSHKRVVGLQSRGSNIVAWQWFCIMSLKNADKKKWFTNGPTNVVAFPNTLGCQKCNCMIACAQKMLSLPQD